MGIESASASNRQNNKELEEKGEKRFRMRWPRMMSEVSHAQRPPRQRLRSNRLTGEVIVTLLARRQVSGKRGGNLH